MRMAKPGRKPKGDRSPMHVRIPRNHRVLYEQAAATAGLPLSDYVAIVLARAHELDEPDYVQRERNRHQVELPLGA